MEHRDVRETVSEAYAEALKKAQQGQGGCCGPSSCSPGPSAVAQMAGYAEREKTSYAEAAASSFGCGNPLAFVDVQPGETVLDLGSGAGLDLLLAAEKVGPEGRVIGVDMTDPMIEAAQRNVRAAGFDTVEVRKGHIEELPVESGSVDWVISNCVINLSPDKEKVFAEIARVLRPGGRLSISDIMVEDLPEWLRKSAAAYTACIGGAIAEPEYLAGLRRAGLGEVEVTERLVYDEPSLRGLVATDLDSLGVDPSALDEGISAAVGKVWSAKVTARKL